MNMKAKNSKPHMHRSAMYKVGVSKRIAANREDIVKRLNRGDTNVGKLAAEYDVSRSAMTELLAEEGIREKPIRPMAAMQVDVRKLEHFVRHIGTQLGVDYDSFKP